MITTIRVELDAGDVRNILTEAAKKQAGVDSGTSKITVNKSENGEITASVDFQKNDPPARTRI